jgi:hypothetical protein
MPKDEDFAVAAKTVFDCAVGRFRDPAKSDLLVLTLRTGDGDVSYVIDRRVAERVSDGLAQIAKKLSAPRTEN